MDFWSILTSIVQVTVWGLLIFVLFMVGLSLILDGKGFAKKVVGVGVMIIIFVVLAVPIALWFEQRSNAPSPYVSAGCYRVAVGTRIVGKVVTHYNTFDPIACH